MRTIALVAILVTLLGGCKKDAAPEVRGTVITQGGAVAQYTLVKIDLPTTAKHSFMCEDNGTMPPVPEISCYTHVFITNLPNNLQAAGTRISFSKYKNKGPNPIFSSIYVPRDVEVYDVKRIQ